MQHFGSVGDLRRADARKYLAERFSQNGRIRDMTADVIGVLSGNGRRRLDLARLAHIVDNSAGMRAEFLRLGCRGFSCRLRENPSFWNCGIVDRLNIRFALLAEPRLYFPPKVRQSLREAGAINRHVGHAIGWLLGFERFVDGRKYWYVANVQSDIMSCHASCLKEIFRGWQRVLFRLLTEIARQRGVDVMAIPTAEAVVQQHQDGNVCEPRRHAWHPLYDGVADFFGMRLTRLPAPVDIQTMWFAKPLYNSSFYVASPDHLIRQL